MNFITKHIRAISITLFVLVVILVLVFGQLSKPAEHSLFVFDTLVDISISGKNADNVINEIESILREMDNDFSKYRPNSAVTTFNNLAGGEKYAISDEMADLIHSCIEISKSTDGTFDITTSALSDVWQIKSAVAPPPETEIIKALEKTGYEKIQLSSNILTKTDAEIDFGGVLKGYASDIIREIAIKNGIESGIVNLGGNVCLIGSKDGKPWTVGIVNPFSPGDVYLTVRANNTNIITSGAYQRYFESDGKIYHHILSPHNGYPAESDVASATVISDDGTLADALSTAIFAVGSGRGMEIAKAYGVGVIIIKKDGSVIATEDLNYTLHN